MQGSGIKSSKFVFICIVKIFLISIPVFLVIISCKHTDNKSSTGNTSTITLAKVSLSDLNGQSIDLSQYKGKVVFINFWATWCKPCLAEMPSLQKMSEKLKDKNIVFFFASDEPGDEIAAFKNEKNYDFNFTQAKNSAELNIMGLPTTFIFDKNGMLAFSEMGARDWNSDESISLITKIINL
jgi:thiol-disulfide isomerase/thioredoxin